MKGKIVIATTDWFNLKKGDEFIVIRSYFYNGEGHYILQDKGGKKVDYPDIFFKENKEVKI